MTSGQGADGCVVAGGTASRRTGGDDDAAVRRHLVQSALLGLALVLVYPALAATGRYSGDQLVTFYVLVGLALACHLAEWWDTRVSPAEAVDATPPQPARLVRPARFGWPARLPGARPLRPFPVSASDLMRGTVLFLAVLFLLLGLFELIGGLAGQEATTSGGRRLSAQDQLAGGALQTAAGTICLLLFFTGTRWVPGLRGLREDRPISWLAILVVTQSLATLLSPTSGTESVAATIAHPVTTADLIAGSLPFAFIAVLAVGPIVDRTPRQWAQRLGLLPLRPAWWLVGLAVGILLVPTVDWIFTPLQSHLLPSDCVVQQMQVQQSLAGGETGRGVLASLVVALAAGVDEELLFRGVLLPRFGLVWSSIVFGAFHLQYTCHGLPSVGDFEIVVLGFVFGILRLRGGVIAAILAHAAYDGSILLNDIAPGVSSLLFIPLVAWLVRDELRRRPGDHITADGPATAGS